MNMSLRPVGIKFVLAGDEAPSGGYARERMTFCRFVKEAASGRDFVISVDNLRCRIAEVALGFREPGRVHIETRVQKKAAAIRIGPVEDCDVVLLVLLPQDLMVMADLLGGISARFNGTMAAVCGEATARVYETGEPNVTALCYGSRKNGPYDPAELILGLPHGTFLELQSKMRWSIGLRRKAREGLGQILAKIR